MPSAGGAEGAQAAGPMNPKEFIFGTVWFFLMALFVYYVLVLNPARLREDDRQKFLNGLKKGDEVLTSGGITGRVVNAKSDYTTLEIASNVKVRVASRYILPLPPEEQSAAGAGQDKQAKTSGKK